MPSETNNSLPTFDSPPVIETVLSAQFEPLPGYTNAHGGWFWKNYLSGNEWTQVAVNAPIEVVHESFGEGRRWGSRSFKLVSSGAAPDRVQIIRKDDERMVQIQDTRFAYNWKKRTGSSTGYPSYKALLPCFKQSLSEFCKFAEDAGFGFPVYDQWEVIYVNHIPKGDLWESPSDWSKILPAFIPLPADKIDGQQFDTSRGEWQYIIGENIGRLYVAVSHARTNTEEGPREVMEIRMTARGPVNQESGIDLFRGLDIAHESIVNSFAMITSKDAHDHWKRSS